MKTDPENDDPITVVPPIPEPSIYARVWRGLAARFRCLCSLRLVAPKYEPSVDYTEADVVRYVEEQLDRAVRSRPTWKAHIKLDPQYQGFPSSVLTLRHKFWRIYCEDISGGDEWPCYRLQVSADLTEFLIWFDHQATGAPNIGHFMRSAVHLWIPLFIGKFSEFSRDRGQLGDVLAIVIAHPDKYPMNYYSIT